MFFRKNVAKSVIDHISNADLTLDQIPGEDAEAWELSDFAQTFNGYSMWNGYEKVAEIALSRRHDTLTNVRTCLFFEQRSLSQCGEDCDGDYVRDLVAKIRAFLSAGKSAPEKGAG